TSSVTTFPPLTVAVSPAPGTPAPPHVAALLQLPLVVLLNDAANIGAAAQNTTRSTPHRAIDLVMNPLSSEPGKMGSAPRTPDRTSSVTACPPLTVAVSPAPGTPAPPHVAALLQLPLVVLLNDAANIGAAAQNTTRSTPHRAIDLVMNPLSSEPGKMGSAPRT